MPHTPLFENCWLKPYTVVRFPGQVDHEPIEVDWMLDPPTSLRGVRMDSASLLNIHDRLARLACGDVLALPFPIYPIGIVEFPCPTSPSTTTR